MNIRNSFLVAAVFALCASPVLAQESEEELESRMREAEARLEEAVEQAQQMESESERASAQRSQLEAKEVEMRLFEAEKRMAEAARQVAELSMRQLPRIERMERIFSGNSGPVLGITIGAESGDDPVEGVEVLGVSPGGAAEESGLRAGDVLTSLNGETLTADSANSATEKLLDFMKGVEEGDELDVEYLRNGKSDSVTLTPRPVANAFAFSFNGRDFDMPDVAVAPHVKRFQNFIWMGHDDGFGDMELVALTERLGEYFGTSEGLLVIRAPEHEEMKLEDGDVILNIDGRSPNSVSHAMRILGSYQSGEELSIEIMRDKRKRTIEVEIPDNRQSFFQPSVAPSIPEVTQRTVIIEQDRT
jgi:C-terminal processing protease CtpA/Prc